MRIFKIGTFFLTGTLLAQGVSLDVGQDSLLRVAGIPQVQVTLDSLLQKEQDWVGYYRLVNFTTTGNIHAMYRYGQEVVVIDSLYLRNEVPITPAIQRRFFQSLLGKQPGEEAQRALGGIQGAYSFLTKDVGLAYGLTRKNRLVAVVDYTPEFTSHISGILGANRNADREWIVTGEMAVYLENLWRTASITEVNWKRKDPQSQILFFRHEEPHPLALPFGVALSFSQELWEGEYVYHSRSGSVVSLIPPYGQWRLGGKQSGVVTTARGDSLGIVSFQAQSVYLQTEGENRDRRWLPTRGGYWQLRLEAGQQTDPDRSQAYVQYDVQVGKLWPYGKNWSLHTSSWGEGTWTANGVVHRGQKVRYGGTNTLRGYQEDLLLSDRVLIPQLEWIYHARKDLQLLFFSEVALQKEYQPLPFAYGLGLKQIQGATILEVWFGMGRGDTPATGKLHVKFTSQL
ncbi:MAG: hypothetical protein ACE5DP_03120 [Fidelibacterota bacterium]